MEIQGTELLKKTLNSKKRIVIHRGGSSSSKTYSLVQYAIITALREPGIIFSIYRFTLPALKRSVLRDFYQVMNNLGLWSVARHWKTDNQIVFTNGSIIEFAALDEEQKARGPRRDYLWLNEADEIPYPIFKQLLLRTRKQILIDFNPSNEDIWINQRLEIERAGTLKDVEVFVSNYRSNPYLPKATVAEIESLRPHVDEVGNLISGDSTFWQVYGLGEYGRVAGQIYNNWYPMDYEDFPEVTGTYLGMDFGFTWDPTAIIEVRRDKNKVYIHEVSYERAMTEQDIANAVESYGNIPAYCDIDPRLIHNLRKKGVNARKAIKGPNSIIAGINLIRKLEIFISPESVNIWKEFKKYAWHSNTNGDFINQPIDSFNHALDAIRYAIFSTDNKRAGGMKLHIINQ